MEINEFTESECLPNLKIFGKFEETTHTQKYARKRIDIDFERVSFICALARLRKKENVSSCSGGFSYEIQEKFTA